MSQKSSYKGAYVGSADSEQFSKPRKSVVFGDYVSSAGFEQNVQKRPFSSVRTRKWSIRDRFDGLYVSSADVERLTLHAELRTRVEDDLR